MGTLEQAVTDLFIGAIDPDDFENLLKNTIKLPEEEMEGLIGDVNEKIFREIRGKMVASSTEKPVIAKIPEFITHTDAHEEKKNTEILNKAGIEILSTQSSILPKPPKPVELTQQKPAIIKKSPEIKRETLLVIEKLEIEAGHTPMPALAPTPMPTPTPIDTPKEIPTEKLKEEIHPMLAQKLSSSVSSAVVKTEY
jgi:hypothetical protein